MSEEQGAVCPAEKDIREIWRKVPGDFYSPSIQVFDNGNAVRFNVGGKCVTMPAEKWVEMAWGSTKQACSGCAGKPFGFHHPTCPVAAPTEAAKPEAGLSEAWEACCSLACPMGEECKFRLAVASKSTPQR